MKTCYSCKQTLELDNFGSHSAKADGKASICKPCAKEKVRQYRATQSNVDGRTGPRDPEVLEKVRHAIKTAMASEEVRRKLSVSKKKPIVAVSLDGSRVFNFASAKDAKQDGFDPTNIGAAIKQGKPYRGFIWSFKDDVD